MRQLANSYSNRVAAAHWRDADHLPELRAAAAAALKLADETEAGCGNLPDDSFTEDDSQSHTDA